MYIISIISVVFVLLFWCFFYLTKNIDCNPSSVLATGMIPPIFAEYISNSAADCTLVMTTIYGSVTCSVGLNFTFGWLVDRLDNQLIENFIYQINWWFVWLIDNLIWIIGSSLDWLILYWLNSWLICCGEWIDR